MKRLLAGLLLIGIAGCGNSGGPFVKLLKGGDSGVKKRSFSSVREMIRVMPGTWVHTKTDNEELPEGATTIKFVLSGDPGDLPADGMIDVFVDGKQLGQEGTWKCLRDFSRRNRLAIFWFGFTPDGESPEDWAWSFLSDTWYIEIYDDGSDRKARFTCDDYPSYAWDFEKT